MKIRLHHSSLLSAVVLACTFSATANAAPVAGQGTWETTLKARDIDGHAVPLADPTAVFFYDVTLDITWLRDMRPNGAANWSISNQWAQQLVVGRFDDWRLPHTFDSGAPGCDFSFVGGTDCGYNVALSSGGVNNELAHLFYVTLGNIAAYAPGSGAFRGGSPGVDWGLVNTAYFSGNFADGYWTDLLVQGPPQEDAFFFRFTDGDMLPGGNGIQGMAAVRDGDVLTSSASSVHEPATAALLLLALAGLAVGRRGT